MKEDQFTNAEAKLKFIELRNIASSLSLEDAGILGQARALLHWTSNTLFCGKCGSPTNPKQVRIFHSIHSILQREE